MKKEQSKGTGSRGEKILVLLSIILFMTAGVFMVFRSHGYLLEGTVGFALLLFIRLSCILLAGVMLVYGLRDCKKVWKKLLCALGLCALAAVSYFALRNPVRDLAARPPYITETVYGGYFETINTHSRHRSYYYRLKGLTENGDWVAFDLNKSTYKKYENKSGYTYEITCTPYTKSVISVEIQ